MRRSFDGPDRLVLPRIKDPAELNSYADGSRFLLMYDRGTEVKILSLQWNVARTRRFFFIEGNGVLLPVDGYDEAKLANESLYFLSGRKL